MIEQLNAPIGSVTLSIYLIGGIFLAILAWLWYQHARRMRNKKQTDYEIELAINEPLPTGSLSLSVATDPSILTSAEDDLVLTDPQEQIQSDRVSGRMMMVLAGSFGARMGLRMLNMLNSSGLSGTVGSILLIELDAARRADFESKLPSVYKDRCTYTVSNTLTGGFINRGRDYVDKMREYWVPEVRTKARAACDLHERRHIEAQLDQDDKTTSTSGKPSLVILVASLGSTGSFVGPTGVSVVMNRFPGAQCIGFSAYPNHDHLRADIADAIDAYTQAGVYGFVVADNLPDKVSPSRDYLWNDWGMAAIPVGLIAASLRSDAVVESNNAYTLLFPKEAGGLASYKVFMDTIVAARHQVHPAVQPRYYVTEEATKSAVLMSLSELDNSKYAAVGARLGKRGTSRIDIILTALDRESLQTLEDDVTEARQLDQNRHTQAANYELFFAGTRVAVSPDNPTCPLVAVSIQALADPARHLRSVVHRARNGPALLTTESDEEFDNLGDPERYDVPQSETTADTASDPEGTDEV